VNRNQTTAGTFFLCVVVLFGFILTGCRPSYETQLPKFAKDVKGVVNPTNLQNWAIEFLRTNASSQSLDKTNAPLNIQSLYSQGSPFQDGFYDSNSVWLIWGGGFGHWGIRVGAPTFKPDDTNWNYYIEWEPGIYFWHETH
jgi:hypothetical protein